MISIPNPANLLNPLLLLSIVEPYLALFDIATVSFFYFLANFLNTFIRVSDHLDIIIFWLCQ